MQGTILGLISRHNGKRIPFEAEPHTHIHTHTYKIIYTYTFYIIHYTKLTI